MSMDILPTDEEFLDSLFETPANHHNPTDNGAFLNEMLDVLSKHHVIPEGQDAVEFCRAIFDPQKGFRGFKTEVMTEEARKALPAKYHYLLDTPVGFLHLDELNG